MIIPSILRIHLYLHVAAPEGRGGSWELPKEAVPFRAVGSTGHSIAPLSTATSHRPSNVNFNIQPKRVTAMIQLSTQALLL